MAGDRLAARNFPGKIITCKKWRGKEWQVREFHGKGCQVNEMQLVILQVK